MIFQDDFEVETEVDYKVWNGNEIISIIEYKVEQIEIQNGTHNWWSDFLQMIA